MYEHECSPVDRVGDDCFFIEAVREFGEHIIRGSAIGEWNGEVREGRFRTMIEKCLPIRHAVEIGTWRGLSTAVLAHYADRVTTVDNHRCELSRRLWMWAGVTDKIEDKVITDQIPEGEYDFAFIDGGHTAEQVRKDFESVKSCRRVLFHDYGGKYPNVTEWLDTLDGLEINGLFALWTNTESLQPIPERAKITSPS
jgi:hypothetical protein